MALTRLQNIISSVEGRILYVNPDDFDATDAIDNKGNSPLRPFKTIARAVLEVARYSYVSAGNADDKFDQFTIMLYPGDHIVDNRPGSYAYGIDGNGNYVGELASVPFSAGPVAGQYGWSDTTKQYGDLYKITNSVRGGLIIPRGVSLIGLDLRKTKVRPKFIPNGGSNSVTGTTQVSYTASNVNPNELTITGVTNGPDGVDNINDLIIGSSFKKGVAGYSIISQFTATAANNATTYDPATGELVLDIGSHSLTTDNSIRIALNSLTFRCQQDSFGTDHTYPRLSDPAYDRTINIQSVTATTITVNVGTGGTGQSLHQFQSGTTGGITAVDTSLKISEGTVITDVSCNTGSSSITVGISKPHGYTATDVSNSTNIGSGVTVDLPYEDDNSRTALFRITGGCYFWQFSIFDGDPQGVYRETSVKPQTNWTLTDDIQFSHTKLTVFEYASLHDLKYFYRKVSDVVSVISCEKIEAKIQENRIVGALADAVDIKSVTRNNNVITVNLDQDLEITSGNFVAIRGTISSDSTTNGYYIGQRQVATVNTRSQFTFNITPASVTALDGLENSVPGDDDPSSSGFQVSYSAANGNAPTAEVQVEIDTVESASPYIFNVSLRSVYGICGMHADGSRATGFKSMVVAQYTGISLQKDDTAFLKYREGSNNFTAQIGTESLHTDPEAIYNPLQRSYHVKASNRAVIQAVSVFAVGYADHFIAEDGGDMSITNSNSNFGMNAMRSIGFSDQSFNKDALGKITHIIPPRNVESNPSNSYYESINAPKTQGYTTRIYLSGRDNFLGITSGGSNFTAGNVTVNDPSGNARTVVLGVSNGVVTSASFQGGVYGSFQPGDEIVIPTNAADGVGLDCVLAVGDGLTKKVGKFTIGDRVLDKDGSTITDKIFVPLFANSSAPSTSEQSAEINPVNGNIFDYDSATLSDTAGGWYLNVNSGASNEIYAAMNGNSKYGVATISTTPTSYIKRIVDERVDDDKIYRLRYVTQTESGLATDPTPSFPQRGYVLQVKRGPGIRGRGDRFTDGANLLLLNKYFLAHEAIARWIGDNPGQTELNTTGHRTSCIDDLVNIIEAVAYNLRFGGNDQVVFAADKYVSDQYGTSGIFNDRDEAAEIINIYLKPLMTFVINNGNTNAPVNTPDIGSIENNNESGDNAAKYNLGNIVSFVPISGEEQLTTPFGGCTNVRDASFTLLDIVITALGSDAGGAGTVPTSVTPEQAGITYNRISGHEYNDVYYVYEVEEVTPFQKATSTTAEVPGVYYLTVLKGSIPVNTTVLPGNNFKLSQNIDNVYPVIDIDNIVNDPIIADSVADPITIGVVNTTTGLNSNDVVPDTSFSITKESLSYFFDEYLNNELEWNWTNPVTATSKLEHYYINNGNQINNSHILEETDFVSGIGNGEIRKIPINPRRPTDTLEVELRRPSTIRSGNHTFEYVGFGPGNYSTGFPIKQNKVLNADEVKYSQSLKEQGGIAFYSGLNSQGDLYIGNTVINAVTGKTTENQISELDTLTIKDNLTVIGGSGNTITSTFQGPVSFLKGTTFDTQDNFFSGVKIRNPDGIVSTILNRNSGALPATGDSSDGDIVLNTQAEDGGNIGWVYEGTEWRESGIIGTERIHSYKNSNNYTLNVGSDNGVAGTAFNENYDLDVTTNQRIGTHLDIGVGVSDALPGISSTKEYRLHIDQSWTDPSKTYKPIDIYIDSTPTGAADSKIIEATVGTDTKFSVDVDGNVTIPTTSTYGLSGKAFSTTITIGSVANTAQNTDTVTLLDGQGGNPSPLSINVARYQGGAEISSVVRTFGVRLTNNIGSFVYFGASSGTPHQAASPRDADIGGIGNIADFNSRSMVVFLNGVIQQPYIDYHFDGSFLYFDSSIAQGSRIDIRCLAN